MIYDCDIHSGRKRIGTTPEVFADYVRLACVDQNGRHVLDQHNGEDLLKGLRKWPISWDMYLVCIGFYSR